jgi:hypothetical protein
VRRIHRAALGLGVIAILVGFGYWLTAGISGEVFLVSPDGKPESAPGAEVHIYRCDATHSVQAFLAGPLDIPQSWRELDAKFPPSPPELSDHRLHIIQTLLYTNIFVKVTQYWQPLVARTTTDRSGHFSVRLASGSYLIHVSGQAGKTQAHWLTEAQVIWRSETILSVPIYAYEPE